MDVFDVREDGDWIDAEKIGGDTDYVVAVRRIEGEEYYPIGGEMSDEESIKTSVSSSLGLTEYTARIMRDGKDWREDEDREIEFYPLWDETEDVHEVFDVIEQDFLG